MKTNKEHEEITPEEAKAVVIAGCGCIVAIIAFLAIVVSISLFC